MYVPQTPQKELILKTFPSPTLQICSTSSRIASILAPSTMKSPRWNVGLPFSFLSAVLPFHSRYSWYQVLTIRPFYVVPDLPDLLQSQVSSSPKGFPISILHTTFLRDFVKWALVVLHPCLQDKSQTPSLQGPPTSGLYLKLQPLLT